MRKNMAKIEQIVSQLKADLSAGKYKANQRFPSEYELAEQFGVNNKTANKAVSLLVADGWLIRGKRGQGTLVAAVHPFPCGQILCLTEVKNSYQSGFLAGAQAAAHQHEYLMSYTSPPIKDVNSLLKRLENSPVKGIVTGYYGPLNTSLPVVYMDRVKLKNEEPFYAVDCDNYQSGYDMMSELISRGHRNIVIFTNHYLSPERVQGFHDVMKENGITDFAKRTFYWQETSNYEAGKQLQTALKKFPGVTAFASASDDLMIRLINVLDHKGIDWKNRLALTGFGNLLGSDTFQPVATVDQHSYSIGFTAVENLIALIENRGDEVPLKSTVEAELINPGNIPLL